MVVRRCHDAAAVIGERVVVRREGRAQTCFKPDAFDSRMANTIDAILFSIPSNMGSPRPRAGRHRALYPPSQSPSLARSMRSAMAAPAAVSMTGSGF